MNRFPMKTLLGCVAAGVTLSTAGTAMAVPYASAVVQTGNTVDFILNETADTVTVLRDGGNALVLPGTAGAHSFDMTGFSDFTITVDHTAAAGWAESSSSTANSAFLNFERPNSVAVNMNPGSANFGNIYVGNRSTLPAASGRLMGDGIYILNATGVNAGGELVDDTFVTVDEAQRQVLRNTAFAGRGGGEVAVEAAEEQSKDELKAAMEKAYLLGIDVDAVTTEFVQEQEAVEEALSPEEITEKVSELKSLIELFDQRQLDQARSVLDAVPGAAPAATP